MQKKSVLMVSLGCDKNLVDTEKMLGLLAKQGYLFTDEAEKAQVIVVNSCCFIGDAKEESVNCILEMAQYRIQGSAEALIVTGCLAQRYQEEILREIPEVDAVIGISAWHTIGEVLEQLAEKRTIRETSANRIGQGRLESDAEERRLMRFLPCNQFYTDTTERLLTTGGHYAYLKIAEGCNKRCTYCVIPSIRGNYRSVPMEQLLEEARKLAEEGVRELVLVAQETTVYGVDLYGRKMLPQLLRRLCQIPELYWIRVLYCYPEEITQELIDVIREEPKICHYLDIPIQHASNRILKRMGRRTTREELTTALKHLREEIPDMVLRTTLITGFPGETEEDFEELLSFVDEMEFERLGVFPYSQEENTPAAEMPDQVPEALREERRNRVMELQQEIAFACGEACVDCIFWVMIEGKVAEEDAYIGRTYMDAPGVDGYLFVHTDEPLMSGDFVQVLVTGAAEYDLIGEVYHEDEFTE